MKLLNEDFIKLKNFIKINMGTIQNNFLKSLWDDLNFQESSQKSEDKLISFLAKLFCNNLLYKVQVLF